jgi:aminotransferase in exopolysaccharide biosynthesis
MSSKFVPLSVPNLRGNELKYVTEAINTEWVSTGGQFINDFENAVSSYVKSLGAVSCQNGTAGLHIALKLVGVTEHDEVIVPSLTFIAAVNPVKYIGAEPVFMDADSSLCIDPMKLEDFCNSSCKFENGKLYNVSTGKHIKAMVIVHVFGNMADMVSIMEIASKYNIKVVEDATEALGTYYLSGPYKGRFAGTIGDIGVYSFNGNKIITTGGGGMIVSNHEVYLDKAKYLTTQAKNDELYYVHNEIGYNYRMTNLQAALGLAQLEKLEEFIVTKKRNYDRYVHRFENESGLSLLEFRKNTRPNYWFYGLYLSDDYRDSRDELIQYLNNERIQVRPIWGLINDQLPYKQSQTYNITSSYDFIGHVINIPCSSNLLIEDVDYVVDTILKFKTSDIDE